MTLSLEILSKSSIWIKSNASVFKILGLVFFIFALITGIIWAMGKDVESVAFLLGCISSSMFGVVEVANYIEPNRKYIRDMSIYELLEFIKNSDVQTDWRYFSTHIAEEVVLIEDPRLRLTLNHDHVDNPDYIEDWANKFPNPRAVSLWLDISYDRAVFERKIIVSVDGNRILMPQPKSATTLEVSKLDYKIAALINNSETALLGYMKTANIKISGE